jgi:acyl carrier protein
MLEQIVGIISKIGKLSRLDPREDFYTAGLSSISALQLLLELESSFAVAVPDDRFIGVRTAEGLRDLISDLKQEQQVP